MAPKRAQLVQQLFGSLEEGARQSVAPLLHHPDQFFEADFRCLLEPALSVGMGMPQKEQHRPEQTGPDFTLDACGIITFGFVQTQDRLSLPENQFDLPPRPIKIGEHGGGQFGGRRIGQEQEPAGQLEGFGTGRSSFGAHRFTQAGALTAGALGTEAEGHQTHRPGPVFSWGAQENLGPFHPVLATQGQRAGQIQDLLRSLAPPWWSTG